MRRLIPFIVLAVLVSASLACKTATRVLFDPTSTATLPPVTPTKTPIPATATPVPTPDDCPNGDCITACVDQLQSIAQLGAQGGLTHSTMGRRVVSVADGEVTLVTYPVSGDRLGKPAFADRIPNNLERFQKDETAQKRVWDYFAAVVPLDRRDFLAEYIIFTDGKGDYLAAVSQTDDDPAEWALNVDIQDTTDPKDLTYTLVHEFGHLLTLSPEQVKPSMAVFNNPDDNDVFLQEVDKCSTYFPGEGCSAPDSYIYVFVDRFWGDIFSEWDELNLIEDEDEYYDALDKFYQKYKDQFVTDYAPTSPEEDVAESFSYFILLPKPTGDTLADQKVLFFYEFPELVQLRAQMGRNLCAQLEK